MDRKFLRVTTAICAHARTTTRLHVKTKSVDAPIMVKHYYMARGFLRVTTAICAPAKQMARLFVRTKSVISAPIMVNH